ncbi:MAG: hypothetical protein AAB897_00215 [Patescibacteria group bacterium]
MAKLCGFLALASAIFFPPFFASAHVPFGEFAGTHAVAFVPEPRSPFVGEEVEMVFYLRDLRGILEKNPVVAAVLIQEVVSDENELGIFGTTGETITDGIYTTNYTFEKPGQYRIDFTFWKPDEPEITRDAVFDIEVRELPTKYFSMQYILISFGLFLLGSITGFIIKIRKFSR